MPFIVKSIFCFIFISRVLSYLLQKFAKIRTTRSPSVPDDESISSLELDAMEKSEATKEPEQERKANDIPNGPIIIGGKEYDGVGRDTLCKCNYSGNVQIRTFSVFKFYILMNLFNCNHLKK